jgi:hypothetical protein
MLSKSQLGPLWTLLENRADMSAEARPIGHRPTRGDLAAGLERRLTRAAAPYGRSNPRYTRQPAPRFPPSSRSLAAWRCASKADT